MPFKIKKRFLFPLLFFGFFFAGPRSDYQAVKGKILPTKLSLDQVESHLAHREAKVANLKPGNASRILWADSMRKTSYVVVYLHGFSASPVEGAPLHQDFARRYGYNLYLPRLSGHGLDDPDSFAELTPEIWMQSAREALSIGQLLGDKVLLMSCSSGSTLATYLAAENPEVIDVMMMYSPNFYLGSSLTELLSIPWGLQIVSTLNGGKYLNSDLSEASQPFWTGPYRLEGVQCLTNLIDQTMTKATYQKVRQPCFVAYYYKNEEEQDFVISTEEIKNFAQHCGTPESQKRIIALPDVDSHVILSDLRSKDLESVYRESFRFAEEVLDFVPLNGE